MLNYLYLTSINGLCGWVVLLNNRLLGRLFAFKMLLYQEFSLASTA